jgi:hypothetical protein
MKGNATGDFADNSRTKGATTAVLFVGRVIILLNE